MDLIKAIYSRRAVRDYTDQAVPLPIVRKLIDAAIQAPTALDEQPWAFAVIQGKGRLRDLSDRAKAHFLETFSPGRDPHSVNHEVLRKRDYNLFYNAGTLVVVFARPGGQFVAIDCCLAAENLMLAAMSVGLATCPIGFAQPWLDQEDTKSELGIPTTYSAVLPLIVGYAVELPTQVPRKEPTIFICP